MARQKLGRQHRHCTPALNAIGAVGTRLLNAADTVLFLGLIDGAPVFGADVSSLVEEDLEILLGPNPTFVDLRATGLAVCRAMKLLSWPTPVGYAYWASLTRFLRTLWKPNRTAARRSCAQMHIWKPADVNPIRAPTQP